MSLYDTFLAVLVAHTNANGKVIDALICKELAEVINELPRTVYFSSILFDFIEEYGETCDESYIGRDEEGEKQYHTYNPETHWHERITRELRALGFYKKHEEWALLETV